ncbi:type II toxin-antitoxin system VapC family toxin [Candidatus Woesearchaeota archaeon]|nr:type II toxin-antitoxin system VapC family toxin [Candidatus Woesearchaeota archaeon]
MKFLDTNVLVYGLLKPRRTPSRAGESIIERAAAIVKRIDAGEPVLSSTVHLSEFVNIYQSREGIQFARDAVAALLALDKMVIATVTRQHYRLALSLSEASGVNLNDCLAAVIMTEHDVSAAYTFDADFDKLGVARVMA